MSDINTRIIRGFQTTAGLARYDFNALDNLPSLIKVIYCEDVLPPPTEWYQGTIAIMTDEHDTDTPFICFQKNPGVYVWANFNGAHVIQAHQLAKPSIEIVEVV